MSRIIETTQDENNDTIYVFGVDTTVEAVEKYTRQSLLDTKAKIEAKIVSLNESREKQESELAKIESLIELTNG